MADPILEVALRAMPLRIDYQSLLGKSRRRRWVNRAIVIAAFATTTFVVAVAAYLGAIGFVWAWLRVNKDAISALQSVVTVLAVSAGAVWFFRQGQQHPRIEIALSVTHRTVGNRRIWVGLKAKLTNKGNVPVRLREGTAWLQQIVPPSGYVATLVSAGEPLRPPGQTFIAWERLDTCESSPIDCELEPGESDEIDWDFVIDDEPEVIRAYVHIRNSAKRSKDRFGWQATANHEIEPLQSTSGSENLLARAGTMARNGDDDLMTKDLTRQQVTQDQPPAKTVEQKQRAPQAPPPVKQPKAGGK